MDLATRNLSVVIFLSVVGFLLLGLLITFMYLNRLACFKKCEGNTCFDVKKMIQQAQHDLFTDSSSDDEETTPISSKVKKPKDEEKGKEETKEETKTTETEKKELK